MRAPVSKVSSEKPRFSTTRDLSFGRENGTVGDEGGRLARQALGSVETTEPPAALRKHA